MKTTNRVLELLGLTIDFTNVRAVLSFDDRPIWVGRIVVTSAGRADGQTKVVTCNMVADRLLDLEGECEDDDPIYGVVERWTPYIVNAVASELGRPTHAEAMAA